MVSSVSKNFSGQSLRLNLIFSSFNRKNKMCSQDLKDGGGGDFHKRRIFLRSIKDAKAITFFCKDVVISSSGGTPKIAICGEGLTDIPRMSEIDFKYDCQQLDNFKILRPL